MYKLIKYFVSIFINPFLTAYLKNDRWYKYGPIKILIKQGVFHPSFFFSTKFLLTEVKKLPLADKRLLELGAGSGLISFYTARVGAHVTATDISERAIEGLKFNQHRLNLPITIIKSDLFQKIPLCAFDIVVINPPYYPKNPTHESQFAWYCGNDFQYFKHLFNQLKPYLHSSSIVYMSLSQDCQINVIQEIAATAGFYFETQKEKRLLWEVNYIYSIKAKAH
ncbi:MAG: methyltransferase [Bacteroidia bacterium]|jgi:release factor glutamine methyltransferase|nr:methyltransferase [Bacteroidia bacterium]